MATFKKLETNSISTKSLISNCKNVVGISNSNSAEVYPDNTNYAITIKSNSSNSEFLNKEELQFYKMLRIDYSGPDIVNSDVIFNNFFNYNKKVFLYSYGTTTVNLIGGVTTYLKGDYTLYNAIYLDIYDSANSLIAADVLIAHIPCFNFSILESTTTDMKYSKKLNRFPLGEEYDFKRIKYYKRRVTIKSRI